VNLGIALSGRAASGKSTLAREIVNELAKHGRAATILSFADEIKREVLELYGIRKSDRGGREELIRHGERRRLQDPLYWPRRMAPALERALERREVPVVDDLRFRAEASWLGGRGFYLVRVDTPAPLRAARLECRGEDPAFAYTANASEAQLDRWHGFHRYVRTSGDGRSLLSALPALVLSAPGSKKGDAGASPIQV